MQAATPLWHLAESRRPHVFFHFFPHFSRSHKAGDFGEMQFFEDNGFGYRCMAFSPAFFGKISVDALRSQKRTMGNIRAIMATFKEVCHQDVR